MSKRPETPAERLIRTSEIYRRMRAEVQPAPLAGPGEPARPPDPGPEMIVRPVDPLAAAPQPSVPRPLAPTEDEPDFVRRLLTRRPDRRELVLLGVVAIAVLYSIRPF